MCKAVEYMKNVGLDVGLELRNWGFNSEIDLTGRKFTEKWDRISIT